MTNTIFKADNITRDYKDKKKLFHAIKNISFELHAGEVISFVGPNGAGKTTLIKSISNYLVPTSGQVEVEGVDLIKYPRKARKKMGIVFGGDRVLYRAFACADGFGEATEAGKEKSAGKSKPKIL